MELNNLYEQYQDIFNKLFFDEENNEKLIEELAKIEIAIEEKMGKTAIVLKDLEAQLKLYNVYETKERASRFEEVKQLTWRRERLIRQLEKVDKRLNELLKY